MYHYFYKITDVRNNKFYYGVHSTDDLNDGYMGSGVYITRLIKKFGEKFFKKEILKFFDSADEMFEYEANTVTEELVNNPNCYNLTNGGFGYKINHICSEEVRKKISEKTKGRPSSHKGFVTVNKNNINKMIPPDQLDQYLSDGWIKGVYMSEESRKKLCSRGMLGKKLSEESKRKMSEIKKRQFKEGTFIPASTGTHLTEDQKRHLSEINTGKKHSEESRRKMSLSQTGKKHSKEWRRHQSIGLLGHKNSEEAKRKIGEKNSKPVIRINPITNERVEYPSISEAEKQLGYRPASSSINYAIKHNVIKHGYLWELKPKT